MYPFFTQFTKDIRFKQNIKCIRRINHKGYPIVFVHKNQAINYVKLSQIIKCIIESQKISNNHSTN
jgi:hypothetical protein